MKTFIIVIILRRYFTVAEKVQEIEQQQEKLGLSVEMYTYDTVGTMKNVGTQVYNLILQK